MSRVLIFSTAYFPHVGGAEVAVKEITDCLTEYEFTLVTARLDSRLPKQEKIGRVMVHRLGWGNRYDKYWLALWGARYARGLQRAEKFSAVWAIMASFGGFAALSFKEQFPTIPYLLTLQEGDNLKEVEQKTFFWRERFKKIFTAANSIQCISRYLADWAGAMGATAPITVIPNGVDLSYVSAPIPREVELIKREGEKVLVSVSRLVKKNGLADIIRALKLLPQHITLWLIGSGPDEASLKRLAEETGVAFRLKFLGFMPQRQLFSYLKEADIFIRPSLSEGLGNAFLEAMAAGLPTVGTPVGGIVDFLQEGETGWLVEPSQPQSIATKVLYLLDPLQAEEVKRVARAGQALVETSYSWEKIAPTIGRLFQTIIMSV